MKKAALLVCMLAIAVFGFSQDAVKPAGSNSQTVSKTTPPVEKVEGFLAVTSYFGGKLLGELKSRFNLSEESAPTVPTKVLVKVGGLSFERTEDRPVKGN